MLWVFPMDFSPQVWLVPVGVVLVVACAASPAQKGLQGWAGDTMELQPPTSMAWKSCSQCSWGRREAAGAPCVHPNGAFSKTKVELLPG